MVKEEAKQKTDERSGIDLIVEALEKLNAGQALDENFLALLKEKNSKK